MKVDCKKIYWAVKIGVFLLFAGALVFLTVQKIVPAGVLTYSVAFDSPNKFIYGLYPEGRVELRENGWALLGEPVYWKIYAPKKFSKAEVVVKYKNSDKKLKLSLGVKLNAGEVPYYFKKLEPAPSSDRASFSEQKLEFDLSKASFEKNKFQFGFSAPGIELSKEPPLIVGVTFKLY